MKYHARLSNSAVAPGVLSVYEWDMPEEFYNVKTVSYTHLDVYKRQPQSSKDDSASTTGRPAAPSSQVLSQQALSLRIKMCIRDRVNRGHQQPQRLLVQHLVPVDIHREQICHVQRV